jgi:hypothetical protein
MEKSHKVHLKQEHRGKRLFQMFMIALIVGMIILLILQIPLKMEVMVDNVELL